MAAGDVSRFMRVPGRLVVNPTDLSDAYPYNGTEIGRSHNCRLEPVGSPFPVLCEGLGETTDILEGRHEWVFSCVLRGWDDDAIAKMFEEAYIPGATSQHAVYMVPGSIVAGSSALDRAVMVLYVPDDVIHVPAVLIYRGVPDWAEGAQLAFQRREELGLPVTLRCLRDGNNNILAIGRVADLSLSA